MARTKEDSGSGVVGKVGNVVFVQRYGKTYIRSRPTVRKNSGSEKQKMYRERFRKVNLFCYPLKTTIIAPIWNVVGAGTPCCGYSLFLQANLPAFTQDGTLSDTSKLHFSTGKLPVALNMTVVRDAANPLTVHVTWTDDPKLPYDRHSDELWLITGSLGFLSSLESAGNPGNPLTPQNTGSQRASGTATMQIPVDHTDLWLYFASKDQRSFSPDQYFNVPN